MQNRGEHPDHRPDDATDIEKHQPFRPHRSTERCRKGTEPQKPHYIHNFTSRGNAMTTVNTIEELANGEYKWGFISKIDEDRIPRGLSEDTIRLISAKKAEPEFMLEWRLKAYRHWASLERAQAEPKWAYVKYPPIDYQDIVYYSAPKPRPDRKSLDEVDPEVLE